jgi:hypothetical protein
VCLPWYAHDQALLTAANSCRRTSADAKSCMRTDAAYKAFLEELERQPEALPTAEQQLDQKLEAGESSE